uniref:Peptidase M28 domain-containing protein n=1 Tax=Eutreptiella gymnastica TaxID=73025 RepID=A0A7S1HXI9_9EUGL|mmetsp:Transcript_113013/g.196208  ORF Transcript_113013/g.196208 Transcript_113013/m.196208 type:complete len:384 (+) Transcript_113013:45-1196(+)
MPTPPAAHRRPPRKRQWLKTWRGALLLVVLLAAVVVLWPKSTPSGSGPPEAQKSKEPKQPNLLPGMQGWSLPEGETGTRQLEVDVDAIIKAGPRVAGSYSHGHNSTRDMISHRLEQLGWDVSYDMSTQNTPHGPKDFITIIGTWRPFGPGPGPPSTAADMTAQGPVLVLAAHYDSKLMPYHFVGATDSAASCGMLLDLAHNLTQSPPEMRNEGRYPVVHLVFFDGEEAVVDWTREDSIYGARHLAETWAAQGYLGRIELFVLLDLIGAHDAQYLSWFKNTQHFYLRLADLEDTMRRQGLLRRTRKYFHRKFNPGVIEDDHTPFLERGVPILHIIPWPFPKEWHTAGDDASILNWGAIYDMTSLIQRFVRVYLRGPISPGKSAT